MLFLKTGLAMTLCLAWAVTASSQELDLGDTSYRHDGPKGLHQEYQKLFKQFAEAPKPGDKGYKAEEFGGEYPKLFTSEKCHCTSGQCRPTLAKSDKSSPSGIIMLINGKWCPVPQEALLTRDDLLDKTLPPKLLEYDAHICTYDAPAGADCPPLTSVECGWVNRNM